MSPVETYTSTQVIGDKILLMEKYNLMEAFESSMSNNMLENMRNLYTTEADTKIISQLDNTAECFNILSSPIRDSPEYCNVIFEHKYFDNSW